MGTSNAHTKITLLQNQFFPGEKLKISLDCDNIKNKLPVKSFKFKMFR